MNPFQIQNPNLSESEHITLVQKVSKEHFIINNKDSKAKHTRTKTKSTRANMVISTTWSIQGHVKYL